MVEELDKKNVVIYQEDVYLPFEGIADSLFLKPGTLNKQEAAPKEAKTSFFKRQPKTKHQEKTPEEKAAASSLKHETPKPRTSSKRSFWVYLGRVFGVIESSRKSDTCWLITYASLPSRKATLGRIQGTFKSKNHSVKNRGTRCLFTLLFASPLL